MLNCSIESLIGRYLEDGAEGLTWEADSRGGKLSIAAADDEGNERLIHLQFSTIAEGDQRDVHALYKGSGKQEVARSYCNLLCTLYDHLLQTSGRYDCVFQYHPTRTHSSKGRFQHFHSLLLDKESRSQMPQLALFVGYSMVWHLWCFTPSP